MAESRTTVRVAIRLRPQPYDGSRGISLSGSQVNNLRRYIANQASIIATAGLQKSWRCCGVGPAHPV